MEIDILPQFKIIEWLQKLYSFPKNTRNIPITEVANMAALTTPTIYKIIQTERMSHENQIRFSIIIKRIEDQGGLRQVKKRRDYRKEEVPLWRRKRFAEILSNMSHNELHFLGVSKQIALKVKKGEIPNFRKKTLERICRVLGLNELL